MNSLKAPSLQSLLESDRGSNDSLLAESLQLDLEELDDEEYSIPPIDSLPTLESVLSEFDSDFDSVSVQGRNENSVTPTPSIADENSKSILRHVVLQGVTAQLTSAVDRVGSGLATSAAVSQMIAIGTSHGHILAFDCTQTLKWCSQDGANQGAVSALSFNEDNTRLLAGFARGTIIMIDTLTGDAIRTLTDLITPNTGVLHLKWTGKPALALCSDSGGSVWSLSFTRRMGIRGCDSRCLFSGARGEVCTIEPLLLGDEDHPLKNYTLVALATLSKFFVVMIRPRLKVIKFHPMPGLSECLPLLSWQMVLIQAADTSRTIDPVLAAARGSNLYFHQLSYSSGRISLIFLRHIILTYNLLAIHWLGPKSLACLDTSEVLHLSDVRTNKELEFVNLSNIGLMYNSAQFKALATGGNVSPALALAGASACYNTVLSQGSQLYVLAGKSLHGVNARAWCDRISYLISMNRWDEAIELAVEGYRNATGKNRRLHMAKERILRMFDEYLNATRRTPEVCLQSIVACLIEVGEKDLLWQELYDRLQTPDFYLDIIASHIEAEDITIISPSVCQVLVDYLWRNRMKKRLENIILKLDWQSLDLHQVLTICKKEKLYKAQIHLNAKALGDYTASIVDLVPLILNEDPHLGNCLLVYISSCLSGRGYPNGEIAPNMIPTVKHEVLRCLTVQHTSSYHESELPYPYLRKLLEFDTRETLNVISLAFQEKEFNGELGLSHRQRIINILLEILTPEYATWSQIGCLLNFVAQQIATRCLPESDELLDKVYNYLTLEHEDQTRREHQEREQTWLELLRNDCLSHIPINELLETSKRNKCYRVTEYILDQLARYDEIFDCYLLDEYRHMEMFSYIAANADDPSRKILSQVLAHFDDIVSINCEQITKVIVEHFLSHLNDFMKLLEASSNKLFNFLKNLHGNSVQFEAKTSESYLDLLCQYNPEQVYDFLSLSDSYRLEQALDIVKRYDLTMACILLYEKQGDYQSAFDVSLEMLREAPESYSETCALQVSALCTRASAILSESQREELWHELLIVVLSRPDLTQITKNILHSASPYVDLSKLVQLVLNSGTQTGEFGDIRQVLIGMLNNSKYETLLLQTTSRVLEKDLHERIAKDYKHAKKGLFVKSIKCLICREKLYKQQKEDILIFGDCGHPLHAECANQFCDITDEYEAAHKLKKLKCPRCDLVVVESKSIELVDTSSELAFSRFKKTEESVTTTVGKAIQSSSTSTRVDYNF